MEETSTTIHRQAGTALLAVVQHLHQHQLGTPVSITTPTLWEPHVSLFIESRDLDRWLDEETSGFIVLDIDSHELAGRIAGRRHERLLITGRLETLGIRVRLTAVRPMADLAVVRTLPAVTA